MTSARSHGDVEPGSLHDDIAAYRQGDGAAADRLAGTLHAPLRIAAEQFLGREHGDVDDVVQDALLSTLKYLSQETGFRGDPVALAVTIARNRCRDLIRWRRTKPQTEIIAMADWLAADDLSPLDELLADERTALVQRLLDSLSSECRHLLYALYIAGRETDLVRQELGLTTVQGVYYRRSVCLEKARKAFQFRGTDRSAGGRLDRFRRLRDWKGDR